MIGVVADQVHQVGLRDLQQRQQLRLTRLSLFHIKDEPEVEREWVVALHRPRVHVRRNRWALQLTSTSQHYDETSGGGEDLANSVDFPAEVGIGDVGDHDDTGGELQDARDVGESVDDVGHTPLHLHVSRKSGGHPLGHGECEDADGRDDDGGHVQPAGNQPHLLVGQQTRHHAVQHRCGEGSEVGLMAGYVPKPSERGPASSTACRPRSASSRSPWPPRG